MDAALLAPWGEGDPREPSAWLGVVLPADGAGGEEAGGEEAGGIALFDLRTGLPVPSPGDPDRPVRLGELQSDAAARAAVGQFYEDARLPVPEAATDAAALAALAPRLVGTAGWWKLAHGVIDLPAGEAFGAGGARAGAGAARPPRTFAGLYDTPIGPGLVGRVAAAGGWEAAAVSVWPVPDLRADAANEALRAGEPLLADSFAAPLRLGAYAPAAAQLIESGLDQTSGEFAARYQAALEEAKPVRGSSDLMWRYRHEQLVAGRSALRSAAAGFEELLSGGEEGGGLGGLLGPPLPPTTERSVRAFRGEQAAQRERDRLAAESSRAERIAAGEDVGTAAATPEPVSDVQTVLRAALEDGVVPFPLDPARPAAQQLPADLLETHAAAALDATFFLSAALAGQDRPDAAAGLLARLATGPPNPRAAASASRLAELVADAGEVDAARTLARNWSGGPDGPRLRVWLKRWAAE